MNTIAKTILGSVMLAGAAVAFTAPASAGFAIGFGYGPGYYGPPARAYYGGAVCDPYSRYYNPYDCDDEYYVGPPLFIDGYWYDRPLRSRFYGGHREFWVNNGWRSGGFYRGGGNFYHGGGHGGGYGGGYSGGHGGGYGGGHSGGYGGGHGGGDHGGHH
ncbi:MAG: hypothetical protein P4L57_04420 [Rhizomicrobium sp.]|nr:hypothetical protein [Rhizomicrobium sp.]